MENRGESNLDRGNDSAEKLHHANTFTIGAYPGGAVAYSPLVFLKTLIADLKATGTTPTEGLLFLAAMTLVFPDLSFAITRLRGFAVVHISNSPAIQSRYSLLPAIIATAMISGVS